MILEQRLLREKKLWGELTSCHIAWRKRSCYVHEAHGYHFLVPINVVTSNGSKRSANSNGFLRWSCQIIVKTIYSQDWSKQYMEKRNGGHAVRAIIAEISPTFAASPTCGPLSCNWWIELGFRPPLICFTIFTPCLSAFVKNTIKVDNITDIRGAIAGNQKSFLFLLPCKYDGVYQDLMNKTEN